MGNLADRGIIVPGILERGFTESTWEEVGNPLYHFYLSEPIRQLEIK
jgi:hypothetical protein